MYNDNLFCRLEYTNKNKDHILLLTFEEFVERMQKIVIEGIIVDKINIRVIRKSRFAAIEEGEKLLQMFRRSFPRIFGEECW